ncbi:DNA-binding SARP family transcriptional activator [Streptosporangium album]|uniref:DNA-binding SARP family transcriptional activator n=1 Tax=Streptosporangium album TaxID=47479 RepID=A0A7W7RZN4_9ACTN|nr:BTAD domain-containing putative transcriptional regulator [Streptosporangium album]MBB4940538.1 DNA-binding SARP family transcriptional activator [Streptosporangium album]
MANSDKSPVSVTLLGGFRLLAGGDQVKMSGGSERLLAFVALCGHPVPRPLLAGTLWPDTPERRAAASLRSTLVRLNGAGRQVLNIGATEIRLRPEADVDVHDARSLARRILDPGTPTGEQDLSAEAVALLSNSLLPGWYDDWAVVEAEEWHQQRLHALETLADDFIAAGRYADAVAAAGVAARADPLRESARTALIRAHLAEGNQAEALRCFEHYRQHLHAELGLQPTSRLCGLVGGLRSGAGR